MAQGNTVYSLGPRRNRHRKRRLETTALGFAILLFAAIGLCVAIGFVVKSTYLYVKDYLGPDETADFFEEYISPVVMEDPEPFTDLSKVSSTWLMKTAILATLSDDDDSGKYAFTADSREIVPKADIAKEFESLFGGKITPVFETFTDGSNTYEYNSKEGSYYIPMIAYENIYTPDITGITRSNGYVKLVVDYIPGSDWAQNSDGTLSAPAATKTMIYTLKGSRGNYVLVSIENSASSVSSVAGSSDGASSAGSQAALNSGISSSIAVSEGDFD